MVPKLVLLRTLFACGLLAVAGVASAGQDVAAIVAQQTQMRAEAQAGTGRYKDMPQAQRDDLVRRQAAVLQLVEGRRSTDELDPQRRTDLFNELEAIEAIVNRAEDERMVCEYRKAIGSNRKERVCKTVAQRRKEQEEARSMMGRATRCGTVSCTSSGG